MVVYYSIYGCDRRLSFNAHVTKINKTPGVRTKHGVQVARAFALQVPGLDHKGILYFPIYFFFNTSISPMQHSPPVLWYL